ncbi:MAG: DUF6807 family protein [Candidatus Korobacteraceae bacterium]
MALKTPDGRVALRYVTTKGETPNLAAPSAAYFHPLNSPSGVTVTAVAPGDHRHHRGMFLAWHSMEFRAPGKPSGPNAPKTFNITRGDYWGWGQYGPVQDRVIENREVKLVDSSAKQARVEIRNEWMAGTRALMEEAGSFTVREEQGAFVIDAEYRLTPAQELYLNQNAFGGFCVRARNDGEFYFATPEGKVDLPNAHYSNAETDWPMKDWYDYTITLQDGKTAGAAVIDHPANPASKWHGSRSLSMLNPVIVANGPVLAEHSKPLTLRYRVVVHDGHTPTELLNRLAREWRGK